MSLRILREANTDIPPEIMEFADKVDFNELNKILSEHLGIAVKLVPGKIEKGYHGYRYPAEMDRNLADKCGIMSDAFDSVNLYLFNSSITTDKNVGTYFWCTPHFRYHLKEGGSNSIKLCTAVFTAEDGWNVRWGE